MHSLTGFDVAPYGLLWFARKCYGSTMTTAEEIEKAVEKLGPRELARFRAWFEAFDARQFDAAIELDAHAGKLDVLAEEALAAHRAGRSREL
jgi:hypothetical protein